jgi:S-adenosylmethionine:tRNA ribosyltransferase-isomerase
MLNRPTLAIQDYDYNLPDHRIAYEPANARGDSKLLVWDKTIIAENTYAHIAEFIPAGSSLFFNNSKVIAARILLEKENNTEDASVKNSCIEIFCLEPSEQYIPVILAMQATKKVEWNCLVGGAKKWKAEYLTKEMNVNGQPVIFRAKKINQLDGKFLIEFSWDHDTLSFSEILHLIGNIPLPPYIVRKATEEDKDRYQTTYAIEEGSVAAPTAGLHFSKEVFEQLEKKQIQKQFVTLHVGAGTFMPVKSETIDQHIMHAEFMEVDASTIKYLLTHEAIAVGTTSLRTLESLYWLGVKLIATKKQPAQNNFELQLAQWDAMDLAHLAISKLDALTALLDWMQTHQQDKLISKTQLMITPGYTFQICNGLVTNFHQPKSTLLLIIAAIAGDEWKNIYQHALDRAYRFLSYGDGCLFWIKQ